MKINQDYYGIKENWRKWVYDTGIPYTTNITSPFWYAVDDNQDYNSQNIMYGVDESVIKPLDNTLDNSIALWGVNHNARFLKENVLIGYFNKDVADKYSVEKTNCVDEPEYDKPLIMFTTTGSYNNGDVYVKRDESFLAMVDGNVPTYADTVPVTSFNYQEIVMLCSVCYVEIDSNLNNIENNTLGSIISVNYAPVEEYFDKIINQPPSQEGSHRVIVGGVVTPFFKHNKSDERWTALDGEIGIAPHSYFNFGNYQGNPLLQDYYCPTANRRKCNNHVVDSNGHDLSNVGYLVFGYVPEGSTGGVDVYGIMTDYINGYDSNHDPIIPTETTTPEKTIENIKSDYPDWADFTIALVNDEDNLKIAYPANYTPDEVVSLTHTLGVYVNYSDEIENVSHQLTKDEIYREFAYLGFWFTGNVESAIKSTTGTECTDDLMFLPEFNSDVVTTGKWKKGKETATMPNATWNDVHEDTNYDPNKKTQSGTGTDDPTPPTPPTDVPNKDSNLTSQINRLSIGDSVTLYAMPPSVFKQFIDYTVNVDLSEGTYYTDWGGLNPTDFVLFANIFPFSNFNYTHDNSYITLGKVQTNVITTGTVLDNVTLDFGEVDIPFTYNDFRDFEPYTTYSLYIPFLGVYDIDSSTFVNHKIGLTVEVDLISNTALAFIYRDGFLYDTLSAVVGYSLPITGREQGSFISKYQENAVARANLKASSYGSAFNFLSKGVNTIGNIASNPVSGTINSLGLIPDYGAEMMNQKINDNNMKLLQYQLITMKPKPITTLGSGGASSKFCDEICQIIVSRHYELENTNTDIYAENMGYACVLTDTLKNIHGFTQCSSIHMKNISNKMTDTEYQAITTALTNGVILP